MRIDVNLSSEPFRNRSLFWLSMALAYAVVLAAGLAVLARSGAVDADADRLKGDVAKQEKQIGELEAQIQQMRDVQSSAVVSPADRVALDEARALIDRKSVSWSQLLVELEHFVPARSKLNSVGIGAIQGTGANRAVTLQLALSGMEQSQVTEILAKFDASGGRFSAEPQTITPSDTGVEYSLGVTYRPGVGSPASLPPVEQFMKAATPRTAPRGASGGSKPGSADAGDEDDE